MLMNSKCDLVKYIEKHLPINYCHRSYVFMTKCMDCFQVPFFKAGHLVLSFESIRELQK